jgi:organic radical activating enzyme
MMNTEDIFTSTGAKYLMHPEKIMAYRKATGHSIITTQISPEGHCNLTCAYCSVRNREKSERIELAVIQDYITKLMSRGLKGVIITGGGEPTLYPKINELIEWLAEQGLSIGMLTNGTLTTRVRCWDLLTWARISINRFPGWLSKIDFPGEHNGCVIGLSYVVQRHDWPAEVVPDLLAAVHKINPEYVRIVPDCLAEHRADLTALHSKCATIVSLAGDPRFFHQHKYPRTAACGICHQSYFRPYLSEVDGGTVFPCDSLVLNDQARLFADRFSICAAGDVLDYLDGKIKVDVVPSRDCTGCAFANTVEMLGTIKEGMRHSEFV